MSAKHFRLKKNAPAWAAKYLEKGKEHWTFHECVMLLQGWNPEEPIPDQRLYDETAEQLRAAMRSGELRFLPPGSRRPQ